MHSKSAPKTSTISPIPMSPAPAPAPRLTTPPSPPPRSYQFAWTHRTPPSSPFPHTLSPPLIAMIAVVGTAFLIVLYARLLSRPLHRHLRRRRRRRRPLLPPSPPSGGDYHLYYHSSDASSHHQLSPYGLDDSAIGALPLAIFSSSAKSSRDCAVCLLEFEDGELLRSLPLCSHNFHVDCIDTWLRSHANCPLCRAAIFAVSPFPPLRAARIRPSFDDFLLLHPASLPDPPPPDPDPPEIMPDLEDGRRDFLLTRSYSFGFERTAAAESSTTPWRYRQHRGGGGGLLWSKRWASPFIGASSSSRAARVFSFRSYRRSPFQRRRGSFLPLSESRAAPASRRTRSLTSPVAFIARAAPATSSRQRCGDPEALLSPERLTDGSGHRVVGLPVGAE